MTTFTVHSPVAGYTGEVGNVPFRDGVAQVDAERRSVLAYLRRRGYRIVDPEPAATGPAPDDTNPPSQEPAAVGAEAADTTDADEPDAPADDKPRRGGRSKQ